MQFALRSLTLFKVFRLLVALMLPLVIVGAITHDSPLTFIQSALSHYDGYMLPVMTTVFYAVASLIGILFILLTEVHASDHVNNVDSSSYFAGLIEWAGTASRNSVTWLLTVSFIAGNFLILFVKGVCFFTCR